MTDVRILVTGPRDWPTDWDSQQFVFAALNAHTTDRDGRPIAATVIEGGCETGVDKLVRQWSSHRQHITPETHAANWTRLGPAAGPARNQVMADAGADECLAFIAPCTRPRCARPKPHDSHGTADCIRRAEKAGIPVRRFTQEA
jgi:hypothetical protein